MANKQTAEDFWREYEAKIGEEVLARGLALYSLGWQEFDGHRGKPLWGLVMATSGGFRFHHFPQSGGLLGALSAGAIAHEEKTIFIPSDKIVSATLNVETKWHKKIFSPGGPFLLIGYDCEKSGESKELKFSSVHRAEGNAEEIALFLMRGKQGEGKAD
ncbi:MAG: hypothetical protein FWE09_05160 [Treponema sp.]|nr:hypothetical protein [Treponema sp.]